MSKVDMEVFRFHQSPQHPVLCPMREVSFRNRLQLNKYPTRPQQSPHHINNCFPLFIVYTDYFGASSSASAASALDPRMRVDITQHHCQVFDILPHGVDGAL